MKTVRSGVMTILGGLIYTLVLLSAAPLARTQDCHGGPPPDGNMDGGPHRPPPGGPPPGGRGDFHGPPGPPGDGMHSPMRGGLQLGPPGRWWDDIRFAQELGLSAAQEKRMDEIFDANRATLFALFRSLEREESTLERMTAGSHLDEEQILQQIDQVSKARGALEKANAHMLLEIRKQMTDDQIGKLDEHRPTPRPPRP